MSNGIFLLLGTNLGSRLKNLNDSKQHIKRHAGVIINESSVYETAPWGVSHQPNYLNQVIQIETDLLPKQLLSALLEIEQQMGRVRQDKWEARTIDIDILLYHDAVIHTDELIVPHPRLQERNFTLIPLCQLAPTFLHPIFHKSIKTLLEECTDPLSVSSYTEGNTN